MPDTELVSIVQNMPFEEYAAADGWNSSKLVKGITSMHNLKMEISSIKKEKDHLGLGRCIHTMVLEPHNLESEFAVWEEGRRYGKKWNEFCELHEGKSVIKADEWEQAKFMTKQIMENVHARKIIDELEMVEVSLFYMYGDLKLKCRLDGWKGSHRAKIADIKSCRNSSPKDFGRDFINFKYAEKLGMYKWVSQEVFNVPVDLVQLICIDTTNYDVVVYNVPDQVLDNGFKRIKKVIDRIPECIESGIWPGLGSNGPMELFVPNWAMFDEDE